MKKLLLALVTTAALGTAASAQGVQIGPGGVRVDPAETATSAATMIVASGAGGRAVAGAAIAARLSSRKRTSLGAG